jgi:hypothetical protein
MAMLLMAALGVVGSLGADGFLGFRLLRLDGTSVRWGQGASPLTVTFAFVREDMHFATARNCNGMASPENLLIQSKIDRSDFEKEVRAAFDLWEQVINIDFQETDDLAGAGILIGAQLAPEGHAFANVDYQPGEGNVRQIEKSLICLNPNKKWKVGFGGSLAVYDLLYTLAHEIGHAIGLDHPDSPTQLMSFSYHEKFRSLQSGDVAGAVQIYGARTTPRPAAETSTRSVVTARRQG